ncbi:hypothetical protein [Roseitranquillus sediminis]|uniref:hypothetical protein n=1 Tax=Roseitranquillus sediminis TaxID=2809051 RepID=UPI001D0CC044|nr:hypothetical protein [Roseitranquillus sediminis]MBM9594822.1 hypothetical protein [Roseitranquillus sediminis]
MRALSERAQWAESHPLAVAVAFCLLAGCAGGSGAGRAFCSGTGEINPLLGGIAEMGVSDEGMHTDVGLNVGAVVRPGRTACAEPERESQF